MTSRVKEFSKGQAVTVETGGKPQSNTRDLDKSKVEVKAETKEELAAKAALREARSEGGRE